MLRQKSCQSLERYRLVQVFNQSRRYSEFIFNNLIIIPSIAILAQKDYVAYLNFLIIKTDTLHNLSKTKKHVANYVKRSATPTYFTNLFYQCNTDGTNIN